jgi:hypothetical protein
VAVDDAQADGFALAGVQPAAHLCEEAFELDLVI